MYFNSLESLEVLVVFRHKHKLSRMGDGGNLAVRERWPQSDGPVHGHVIPLISQIPLDFPGARVQYRGHEQSAFQLLVVCRRGLPEES